MGWRVIFVPVVLPRTARFDEEAAAFGLRFTCDDCGHFDPVRERCLHEWPVTLHRRDRYRAPPRDEDQVVFCKEFEVR